MLSDLINNVDYAYELNGYSVEEYITYFNDSEFGKYFEAR